MTSPPLDLDLEILRMRAYVEKVGRLAQDILQSSVKFDFEKDDEGFMQLAFASKQIEHSKSLCILIDACQYRDAFGLSRLMTEGLVQLSWAMKEPQERPSIWRKFVLIGEFREKHKAPAFSEHKKDLEHLLETHCKNFLNKKKRKEFERGEIKQSDIVPADYPKSWHGFIDGNGNFEMVGTAKMYATADLTPIYGYAHTKASGWVHWDPYSIAEALDFNDDEISYINESKHLGAGALADGFNSIFWTVVWLDLHFNLGYQQKLKEIGDSYIAKKEPC